VAVSLDAKRLAFDRVTGIIRWEHMCRAPTCSAVNGGAIRNSLCGQFQTLSSSPRLSGRPVTVGQRTNSKIQSNAEDCNSDASSFESGPHLINVDHTLSSDAPQAINFRLDLRTVCHAG
jgi:hypothetical protein